MVKSHVSSKNGVYWFFHGAIERPRSRIGLLSVMEFVVFDLHPTEFEKVDNQKNKAHEY